MATLASRASSEALANGPRDRPGYAPRLGVRDLSFSYGAREVLRGVSFEVGAGEILGILGPNGAGKSTLFSVLVGLLRARSGCVFLDGAAVPFGSRSLRARAGVVFQAPSLDATLSVEENLVLGGQLFGLSHRESRRRAGALLEAAGLSSRAGERAGRLSGGLRRRLELARALVHRPSLLLMDEPTTGLDAASFRGTWAAIRGLCRADGVAALVATHRPDEGESCDRVAVLSGGRIIACEPPEALCARVAGDVVTVEADGAEALAAEVAARFDVRARALGGAVHVERERGHELVPRLVEGFPPGRFRSVAIRRPTLADAFVSLTGSTLDGGS